MPRSDDVAKGRALWRALLNEETLAGDDARGFSSDLLDRFCSLFGPALIDNALPGALPPDLVTQARLLTKLTSNRQAQALDMLLGHGHDVIAMKGFATSLLYHRDSVARVTGDLDLLVKENDIEDIVSTLIDEGYSVTTDLPMPPWCFVSEASYLPMTSADKLVDIDLHIHPDCYPLSLGLTTESVFEQARTLQSRDRELRIPSPEHCFLIALSNATKEKLGPQSVKSLLDCGRIIRSEPTLDWSSIREATTRARLQGPMMVTVAMIGHLSGETDQPPPGGLLATASFRAAMRDLATGFKDGFSFQRKLAREAFLTAEPRVTARRVKDRLLGLVNRGNGIPPGAEKSLSA